LYFQYEVRKEDHLFTSFSPFQSQHVEVLFRTHCEAEKQENRCVLQLSTCDAVTALRAAKKFEADVSSIDINMVVLHFP